MIPHPMHFRGGPGTWDAFISAVYKARVWAQEQGDTELVEAYLELENVLSNLRNMDDAIDSSHQRR